MKKKKKSRKLSPEQMQKRKENAFSRKIRNVFLNAGFTYIVTQNIHFTIGNRIVEIDSLLIYENIWLFCEDTTLASTDKDHILKKNEMMNEIKNNMSSMVQKLKERCPDKEEFFDKYDVGRIKPIGLYFSETHLNLQDSDYERFSNLTFVQPKTLEYFKWMTQCIKHSARNEIFRFLKISNEEIGMDSSSTNSKKIKAPIIYPRNFVGLNGSVTRNKVRMVSFMMSAEDLLNMSYVLRKDNWDDSIDLYQRLIDKEKIKTIRKFVAEKRETFYNNIIVALPDTVRFVDKNDNTKNINEINDLNGDYQLSIPYEMNSICVIDGQHRIYAHYESGLANQQEANIAKLRKQLHLLVTGLIFPPDMTLSERIRIQSEIFLDINSTAKPVNQNVLLQIQRIINPLADVSIAHSVLEELNQDSLFANKFESSSLDTGKIKTASIIKFALKYLVTLNPLEGKNSLLYYWNGDKNAVFNMEASAIKDYVKFCCATLRVYFSAIKSRFNSEWKDPDSKLLSVISLNGFIIAFNRQLSINGIKDFEFYNSKFKEWNYDFSKEKFQYTSSQYRKFSNEILRDAFGLDDENL
ncbi:MAG: DGQHR domain-containing protein [Erysipelotrichales bacterium]|nr:DGQHR domain-containing protein [Erysipelotrichales bacterium]